MPQMQAKNLGNLIKKASPVDLSSFFTTPGRNSVCVCVCFEPYNKVFYCYEMTSFPSRGEEEAVSVTFLCSGIDAIILLKIKSCDEINNILII